jgi:hypothetical protein
MGIGHYHAPGGVTVFAEPYDGLPEFDESIRYMWEYAWEDFEQGVRASLSPRFHWLEGDGIWRKDARIVARSRLHDVTLHEDSYGYAYVSVRPRDDLDCSREALAAGNVQAVAGCLFDRLADTYELRRGSGYTSSPYSGREAA